MTIEELQKAYDTLRAQGETDEDILAGLYSMYKGGEICFEELEALSGVLGYEMNDSFKALSNEERKNLL